MMWGAGETSHQHHLKWKNNNNKKLDVPKCNTWLAWINTTDSEICTCLVREQNPFDYFTRLASTAQNGNFVKIKKLFVPIFIISMNLHDRLWNSYVSGLRAKLVWLFRVVLWCWRDVSLAPHIIFCRAGVNFVMQILAIIMQMHADFMQISCKKFFNFWMSGAISRLNIIYH